MCRFCSQQFFILLFVLLQCCQWKLSNSFSTGVTDAGPFRLFCKYFEGPFHGPPNNNFNEDNVSVSESLYLLSTDCNGQETYSSQNSTCYIPGREYALSITAGLSIKGVLATSIENDTLTDDESYSHGEFSSDKLEGLHLKNAVCHNSVCHRKKLENTTVTIPWKAPPPSSPKAAKTVEFVYLLVYKYKDYTCKKRSFVVPPCPSESSSIMPTPSMSITPTSSDSFPPISNTQQTSMISNASSASFSPPHPTNSCPPISTTQQTSMISSTSSASFSPPHPTTTSHPIASNVNNKQTFVTGSTPEVGLQPYEGLRR